MFTATLSLSVISYATPQTKKLNNRHTFADKTQNCSSCGTL
jgi:hypothetical protein